ncbi:MAG: BON domain-containing protein [Planctomycetia bacterium]
MSISRSAYLAAVVVLLTTTAVSAADLAANVAAKMKESGALKGYRVNVKAKAGTVWLEGTVSDARQIDAAIAAAEEVTGVERVVNRLSVAGPAPAERGFSLPASVRSLVGMPSPAAAPEAEADAEVAAAEEVQAAEQALLVDREDKEGVVESGIALTQAVGRAIPQPQPQPQQAAPAKPARQSKQAGPRPLGSQQAKPVPQPRQARNAAGGVQRTAMKSQVYGQPLMMPGSDEGYVGGENAVVDGGYPAQGGLVDGQMVPGSMRFTEGPAGEYCPPGQGGMGGRGGMGGPMPMGAGGMGGPGMGGAGGMPVPVRGNGPNMPNYAWPSYAASPNYAALQYPTQYSPTAWPYIGPFYPYPQVPLGWRRVSLEWDDGWWWLDFDERHVHSHHR